MAGGYLGGRPQSPSTSKYRIGIAEISFGVGSYSGLFKAGLDDLTSIQIRLNKAL